MNFDADATLWWLIALNATALPLAWWMWQNRSFDAQGAAAAAPDPAADGIYPVINSNPAPHEFI